MYRAIDYFKDHYPMLESEYPYTSGPKDAPITNCQYSASNAINVKVKDIKSIVNTYETLSVALQ